MLTVLVLTVAGLVNISSCSDQYKYKLIDSQERPRRSDVSGPGPYLQKDSFFSTGFLEGLFGFGRPEPSYQVKRENNALSRYPYHGQLFGPSPPQNPQQNPYRAQSHSAYDPLPFHRPFYSGVPTQPNTKTSPFPPKVTGPTLNPYTYKVTAPTNPSRKTQGPQNFPFQPVFPAYGYNTTPYPSTPPPTKSNIESQDHSVLKPHHDFSPSSSSPKHEVPGQKLDQFFTIKPFVHKVKSFVHIEKPESSPHVIQPPQNKPESVAPVAPEPPRPPINYNVIQDSAPNQPFKNSAFAGFPSHSSSSGKNNLNNQIQEIPQHGPSMEDLLARIDIKSSSQTQNAPPGGLSNFNNLHTSFSNGVQSHSIAQPSDAHTKHQFEKPQNHINLGVQQHYQIPQRPQKTTAISKPDNFFMPNVVQEDRNHQSQNIQSFQNNQPASVQETSFDVFRQNDQSMYKMKPHINTQGLSEQNLPKQIFLGPTPEISQSSPFSFSPPPNSETNKQQNSFQQISVAGVRPETPEISQNDQMQSFVHEVTPTSTMKLQPLVDQTSELNNHPQTFITSPQMSTISDQNNQNVFAHENRPMHQTEFQTKPENIQPFQTFGPVNRQKTEENPPTEKRVNLMQNHQNDGISKEADTQIGDPTQFLFNSNTNTVGNILNQQLPINADQPPINVSPSSNNDQLSIARQTESLFPTPTLPPAHQGAFIDRISGLSSKQTLDSNFEKNAFKDDLIEVNSVSQPETERHSVKNTLKKVETKVEPVHIDRNIVNKVTVDKVSKSVSPSKSRNKKITDKSFGVGKNQKPKDELFTSFPSRGRTKAQSVAAKPVLEKKKKIQKVSVPKKKKTKQPNKTRRKPIDIKEKEVNKESSLQKLLAIAGDGWDTSETIEKSLKITRQKFKCPEPEGHFGDPGRCEIYYRCVHGTSTQLQCGTGLKWNSKTDQCDWGDNVDCGLNRVPRSGGDKK